jgi:uncharacterized C2H2 Zn-finger protein
MHLATGNEERDEKFLDTNDYRDVGSTDEINAENVSSQIFDAIDDRDDFQDTIHPEGLKTEEPIAEVWNQLEDNEMDLDQDIITTENNACDAETKAADIEDGCDQIPGATEKTNVSEREEEKPNIVKRDSSGSAKGKSRFECNCGKSFSHKTSLNAHKKTHDTKFESSLRCPDCGKKFSTKQMLTRHIKSVHQGYFYECPICGNKQTQAGNTVRHIRKEHPESSAKPIEKCDKK